MRGRSSHSATEVPEKQKFATHHITMKKLIRYFTRWAWRPVIHEFVLRQARAERVAQDLAHTINHIAEGGALPVQAARRAIAKFGEVKK